MKSTIIALVVGVIFLAIGVSLAGAKYLAWGDLIGISVIVSLIALNYVIGILSRRNEVKTAQHWRTHHYWKYGSYNRAK